MNTIYTFKYWAEAARGLGLAVVSYVLTAFVASQGTTDWKSWGIALAIGVAHTAAVYLISRFPATAKPVAEPTPITSPPTPGAGV